MGSSHAGQDIDTRRIIPSRDRSGTAARVLVCGACGKLDIDLICVPILST